MCRVESAMNVALEILQATHRLTADLSVEEASLVLPNGY